MAYTRRIPPAPTAKQMRCTEHFNSYIGRGIMLQADLKAFLMSSMTKEPHPRTWEAFVSVPAMGAPCNDLSWGTEPTHGKLEP